MTQKNNNKSKSKKKDKHINLKYKTDLVDIKISLPSTGDSRKDEGISNVLLGMVLEIEEDVDRMKKDPEMAGLIAMSRRIRCDEFRNDINFRRKYRDL